MRKLILVFVALMSFSVSQASSELSGEMVSQEEQAQIFECVEKALDVKFANSRGLSDSAALYICQTSANRGMAGNCVVQADKYLGFNQRSTVHLCAYTQNAESYRCAYRAKESGLTDANSINELCKPEFERILTDRSQ